MKCPNCGGWSKINKNGRGTTGQWRIKQCQTCNLRFTTFQVDDQPEVMALRLNKPNPSQVAEQEEPPQDSITEIEEWDKKLYQEWLSNLVSQVRRSE